VSYVYFILKEDSVKIGFSASPLTRLRSFRCASLLGTISGDRKIEKAMHRRFIKHRIKGEWFRASEDIIRFASELPGQDLPPAERYPSMSVQIETSLHAKLKAESDRLGMKFRMYVEQLLKKGQSK